MSYTDLDTVQVPADGAAGLAAWGAQVADNSTALWALLSQPWQPWTNATPAAITDAGTSLREGYYHHLGYTVTGMWTVELAGSTVDGSGWTINLPQPYVAAGLRVIGTFILISDPAEKRYGGVVVTSSTGATSTATLWWASGQIGAGRGDGDVLMVNVFYETTTLGGLPAAAPVALADAVWWYRSQDIVTGSEQTLPNNGSGSGEAQRGSTGGVDTDDPTFSLNGPIAFDGADSDLIAFPAAAAPTFTPSAGSWTVLLCAEISGTPTGYPILFAAESASQNGFAIFGQATETNLAVQVGDGTTPVQSSDVAYAAEAGVFVFGAVVDAGTLQTYTSTGGFVGAAASISALGTITFGTPFMSNTDSGFTYRLFEVAVWETALTVDEANSAATAMLAAAPVQSGALVTEAADPIVTEAGDGIIWEA